MRSRVRLIPIVLTLVAGLGAAVVAAVPEAASAATKTVTMPGFSFSPVSITVNVGDTVKWVHDSSATPHSVTADDGSFDSSPNCPPTCMGGGATFSHTFTKAGTFRYYCKIHGAPGGVGMSGTVIVKGAVAKPPTIKTVAPATAKHGTMNDKIKVTGTNFLAGVKAKFSGTGITVKSTQRVDASHLTVTINVAATAAKTKRSLTVTNTNGGAVTKANALSVT